MRTFKLAGAIFVALASTALAIASTASAEITLWRFLPGEANTLFSGTSGKATLQVVGSGTITCKESKVGLHQGELLDETSALAVISFSGCKAFGLAAESLGNNLGFILAHVEIHTCVIDGFLGHFGLIVEVLPLHVDIPSTGLLITVDGGFIALVAPLGVEPTTTWRLNIAQVEGKQEIETCEGGEAYTLESSVDSGAFERSGEAVVEGTFTFETAQEITL